MSNKVLGIDSLVTIREWVKAKDNSLRSELQAQIGSPLVAATVSAMTDQTKVYVYTGSETGYTAGNWYYFNGTNWTSGGVYNSTALETDPTLTIEGVAADAKATGDEITHVKQDINELSDQVSTYKYDDNNLTDDGYISLSDGTTRNDVSGFHRSKIIPIPSNATNITIEKSGNVSGGAVIAFYSGYKFSSTTFISGVNVPDNTVLPLNVSIPATAKYIAFSNRTSSEFAATLNDSISKEYINSLRNGVDIGLQAGTISPQGEISYGATTVSNYLSKLIKKDSIKSVEITPNDGYLCNVAYFNNGTFVSRSDWVNSTSSLHISNPQYDFILMFATEATSSKTADQMLAEYSIQIIITEELQTVYENIVNSLSTMLYEEKVISATACGKIIHYSLDDCYRALRRLYTESYTSIFDNYIFALLKDVHDTTGAIFTMNVINEVSSSVDGEGFDIANVPNTFASEFQANKSWLKFAWHGLWNTASYADFAASYSKFVNNVYRFTGTYDCIDRIVRTETFYGTKNTIQALKDNANAPIVGLLTADDTRTSYYLDASQNAIAIKNGKYFDFENQLAFIRSATRLDNATAAQLIAEIERNPCYQNFVEVWYHEGLTGEPMRQTLKDIGAWATQNGYNNYYPSKIFE